jgi:hypothetical protein
MSPSPTDPNARAPYEPVSPRKFLWMSLLTLSLYDVYWIYRNWQRIGARTGENFSPFWRAFLAPFTVFGLFGRIRRHAAEQGIAVTWNANVLAIAYLLLSFVWLVPSPWVLLSFAGFVPFLPVAATTREINARSATSEPPNDRFSSGNVVGIVVGGLVLVLLVGLTLAGY